MLYCIKFQMLTSYQHHRRLHVFKFFHRTGWSGHHPIQHQSMRYGSLLSTRGVQLFTLLKILLSKPLRS
jgi:hypothetical protein